MKPRTWKQVVLSVPAQYQELLIASLTSVGFNGFLQENGNVACFMEKRAWTRQTETTLRQILSRFQKEFPRIEAHFIQRDVKEQNWNAVWERSIGIIEATDRIIVKPSWKRLRSRDRGKIVLQIDPKMSLGTGHHESTRLCLSLLERYITPRARVLDFGTGTGILAIAAIKLGVKHVVAVDHEEWSIENAKENIKKNGVGRKVSVVEGNANALPKKQFDLELANTDYPTISSSLAKLLSHFRREGILILSGLLTSDLNPLLDSLAHRSAIPLELINENEWVAIALLKSDAR